MIQVTNVIYINLQEGVLRLDIGFNLMILDGYFYN